MDLMAFSRFSNVLAPRIESADFEVSLGLNTFQNNTVAQGIVQSLKISSLKVSDEECKTYNVHHLYFEGSTDVQSTNVSGIEEFLKKPFGTVIVCYTYSAYEDLKSRSKQVADLPFVFANSPHLNPENQVVIAPAEDFEFGFFEQAILVGHPLSDGFSAHIAKCVKTYAFGDTTVSPLKLSTQTLRTAYKYMYELSASKQRMQSMSKFYSYISSRMSITETEFVVAVKIFEELGLLKIGERGLVEVSRKSVDLENSVVYRNTLH